MSDFGFLFDDPSQDEFQNPKKAAGDLGLLDNWDGESPLKQSQDVGIDLGSYGDKSDSVLSDLNPSGTVVSGSKEDVYSRYKKLLEEKPAGESYLQSYLARRPEQSDYKASVGQKILAGLAGLGKGLQGDIPGAVTAGRSILDAGYLRDLKQYTDEGKYVDDAMRMMNSDQERKLKGAQFEITNDQNNQNRKDSQDFKRLQMGNLEINRSNIQDARVKAEEDRKVAREDRLTRNKELDVFKNIGLGLQRQRLDDSERNTQERNDRLKYGSGPGVPGYSEVNNALKEKVISDPLGFGSIFDFPTDASGNKKLNATPQPKWLIDNKEPTQEQLLKYDEYMRQLQSPHTNVDDLFNDTDNGYKPPNYPKLKPNPTVDTYNNWYDKYLPNFLGNK